MLAAAHLQGFKLSPWLCHVAAARYDQLVRGCSLEFPGDRLAPPATWPGSGP